MIGGTTTFRTVRKPAAHGRGVEEIIVESRPPEELPSLDSIPQPTEPAHFGKSWRAPARGAAAEPQPFFADGPLVSRVVGYTLLHATLVLTLILISEMK